MFTRFQILTRFALITALLAGSVAHGDDRSPISYADFAKHPEVLDVELSPDGKYLGVLRTIDDERTVVIFKFPSMEFSAALNFPGRNQVFEFYWASNDRIVASVTQDFGQVDFLTPTGELFAMNADGTKREHIFGYRAGDGTTGYNTKQTSAFRGHHRILDLLWDDPKHILIATYRWTNTPAQPVEAVLLNIFNGKRRKIVGAPALNAQLISDNNDQIRFAFSTSDDFEAVVHSFNPRNKRWVEFERTVYGKSESRPVGFSDDSSTLFIQEAAGEGPYGIFEMNATTGQKTLLYQHEYVDADVIGDNQGSIYGVYIEPDVPRFLVLNEQHPNAQLRASVESAFPGSYPFIVSSTRDHSVSIVGVRNASATTQYFVFDAKVGKLQLLFDSQPWIKDEALGDVKPIKVTTRDGLTLHGYLTTPRGVEAKGLPLVMMPHGGPHGPRDSWEIDPFTQVMATRGYAVLQINYRGSGGYGPTFESSGFREWNGKMQDDLTDSVRWAINQGIADPERVCIYGWSYGGFATLASVVREPDLYKCGVPAAGVYDQDIQYREADFAQSRWGPKYIDKVIGPTPADRRAASPIHFVDRIKAPLLIVHGEEDARVPISHANALIKAMENAGKPYEQLIKPREGHGFFKEENNEEFFATLIDFLDRHIGPKSPYADRSTAASQSAPATTGG